MSPQVGDIAAALAYQVKKEIAENYFGTRRELEEEREDLISQAKKFQKIWVQEVQAPLVLIGELLLDPETARSFFALLGQESLPLAVPDRPDRTFSEVKPLPKVSQIRELLRSLVKQAFRRNEEQIKSCLKRAV